MHSQFFEGLKCESKQKTAEEGRVEARSLVHSTLTGRGACQSSSMGLGRIDKLHTLTRACTQPTHGGQCIVGTLLVLGQATGNTDTQDFTRPGLGEATTFPLIVYSMTSHRAYIQMVFLSQDSRVGISKLRQRGLRRLWNPITLPTYLESRCGMKQSYSSCWELSNDT